MENELAVFCDGCPMLPVGVRAELTKVEPLAAELHRYYFAKMSPEHREHFKSQARLHARVIATNNSDISVDDVAAIVVDTNGGGAKEVTDLVRACTGKVSVNTLQKLFRIRTRCGAFDNRYTA